MEPGDLVFHEKFGEGTALLVAEESVIVRFQNNIQECQISNLMIRQRPRDLARRGLFEDTQKCLCKVMASAIRSVNDEWGVFATSRIALLPHQLWVCRKALETRPSRWLIADDVGLGKTIEAGLILLSLHSAAQLNRVLIIVPASLKEQWRDRIYDMFDLPFQIYHPEEDKPKNNYWKAARHIIASLETLRMDHNKRWKRLIDSGSWDVVIVDEAHRLNLEESGGVTLGYNLIKEMGKKEVIKSLLFFTGTPHKGKDYNFCALLSLLRPDLFSPRNIIDDDIEKISQVMIRNNKQKVTDMAGNKLFAPSSVKCENFVYSDEETIFYDKLTEYITLGLAFAQTTNAGTQRIINFVLATMQKLASSSVAAVRSTLAKRINTLKNSVTSTAVPAETDEIEDGAEEQAAANAAKLGSIQPDEILALEELVALADKISHETKITKIIEKIRALPEGESVLLFTEYKATQAMLLQELRKNFGASSATFINGDGALELKNGRETVSRNKAASDFNSGIKRFLVSTEAAGEGIDLQENCHILFHVDLPWNPMRLHQRVGRLHRYGQRFPVEVYIFHNQNTIESRIWMLLEDKLAKITNAFQAMEDPEDMRMAVIGSQSPKFFSNLFLKARNVPRQGLNDWFDVETSTFGGEDAVSKVRDIFGNASRFDFQNAVDALPQIELEHLMPFMKLSLVRVGIRPKVDPDKNIISFNTPKEYRSEINIADDYNLIFSRRRTGNEEERAGLGLAIVDKLVQAGEKLAEKYAALPGLEHAVFVFRVQDRSTENSASRQRIFGVSKTGEEWKLYRDWELLLLLNKFADKPRMLKSNMEPQGIQQDEIDEATTYLQQELPKLNLPYALPYIEEVAFLCQGVRRTGSQSETGEA